MSLRRVLLALAFLLTGVLLVIAGLDLALRGSVASWVLMFGGLATLGCAATIMFEEVS